MSEKTLKRPEVLAPAGTLEKLKVAVDYGADAVFVGGQAYGLRSRAGNFTMEELQEGLIMPMRMVLRSTSQQIWLPTKETKLVQESGSVNFVIWAWMPLSYLTQHLW